LAAGDNSSESNYNGPTQFTTGSQGYVVRNNATVNGALKCQQISGGDGLVTRADGPQMYMFSFVPLSGLAEIAVGHAGSELPSVFNTVYLGTLLRGDSATTAWAASGASPGTLGAFTYTGAVGLNTDIDAPASGIGGGSEQPSCLDGHVDPRQILNIAVMNGNIPAPLLAFDEGDDVFFKSYWMALSNKGRLVTRGGCVEVFPRRVSGGGITLAEFD
jgi:hypothetical protein